MLEKAIHRKEGYVIYMFISDLFSHTHTPQPLEASINNLKRGCVILIILRKVGISFEVPISDHLMDLLVILLVVFIVCFILSKFTFLNLIKF
jgi:hypothetical protein